MTKPAPPRSRGRPAGSGAARAITVTPGVFDRDVYSTKEMAAILGTNFEYILDEIRAGRLAALKLGGAAGYRIRHQAVMDWMRLREEESHQEAVEARSPA